MLEDRVTGVLVATREKFGNVESIGKVSPRPSHGRGGSDRMV